MGDLTKEEIKAMKAKEAKNRKEKLDNSKIHDAEVIEKYKSMLGLPPEGAPAQAPAPVDQMGSPTGMKRGGKVRKMSAGGNPIYKEWSKTPPNAKTSDSDNMGGLKPAPDNMGGIKPAPQGKKKGGVIRSSASRRADGIAIRGKTRA